MSLHSSIPSLLGVNEEGGGGDNRRKCKYPLWKEWCSVRMERAKGQQASRTETYSRSGEDDNLKRAGWDAGNKREGRGFWRRRRGRRKPDRSKSGTFPRGQGFKAGGMEDGAIWLRSSIKRKILM